MGDSDSEHEVCHVRWHGLGKNWYFKRGVGFWFCEVCKDGLEMGVPHTGVPSRYALQSCVSSSGLRHFVRERMKCDSQHFANSLSQTCLTACDSDFSASLTELATSPAVRIFGSFWKPHANSFQEPSSCTHPRVIRKDKVDKVTSSRKYFSTVP